MKPTHFIRSLTRASLAGATACLLVAAVPAQGVDNFDDPRFVGGADLRELVASGETQLPVMINLIGTPELQSFADWRNRPRAIQHRARVAVIMDQAIASLPANEFTLRLKLENQLSFAGLITQAGLQRLFANPLLESVEHDFLVFPNTDEGITLMNADAIRSNFDGSGMSIAIVDTGIDYNHPALGNASFPNSKVIGGRDIGDNDNDPLDQEGHGTSCAGIAAGNVVPSGSYVGGVAPGAKLYALKIVQGGSGSSAAGNIAAAWDWCVTHQDDDPNNPILVISTSFGGGQYFSACNFSSGVAAANANAAGITVFASSGNDGFCSSMGSPACGAAVISVGAVYDADIGSTGFCIDSASCIGSANAGCDSMTGSGDGWACFDNTTAADQVTCYSNSATFLDILAPSHNASTTSLGGGYTPDFGGTSAACPYAAGAAALLIDALGTTAMTPAAVRSTLIATGVGITDPKSGITKPRIDLGSAVDSFIDTWVDFAHVGSEDGSPALPYNTIGEGITAVPSSGTIAVWSGTTHSLVNTSKAMTILAVGGQVIIDCMPCNNAPGANSCGNATPLSGVGTFLFDNSAATMDGLGSSVCNEFGVIDIDNDVWFRWVPTSSGNFTIRTCGGTSVDTKIAIYTGDICNSASPTSCNDDFCDLQSRITINAVAPIPYLIRIGTYPGAAGGSGTFTITGP